MTQILHKIREDFRQKFTDIDSRLDSLKTKMEGQAQQAKEEVRRHHDAVQQRIDQNRAKVSAAPAKIKEWLENKKTARDAKIAEWKANREISHLQKRADLAEQYAEAMIDVAMAALDDAEQAALEAWTAREDLNSVQKPAAS